MLEPTETNHLGISPNRELNEGEILYACPACGVVVSNHDSAAMRLHHLHVVNARQVDRTREAFVSRMEAQRAKEHLQRARYSLVLQRGNTGLAGS